MTRPETFTVRCSEWSCRATVDLDDDPAALQECCGAVTCDRCDHQCHGADVRRGAVA